MNFIENLFHIAPDDGSGLLEFMILGVLGLAFLLHIIRNGNLKRYRPRIFKSARTAPLRQTPPALAPLSHARQQALRSLRLRE